MDITELKTFTEHVRQILKIGSNDNGLNELANLIYIKFAYPNKLEELLELDESLILDCYQNFLSSNEIFAPTKITNKRILYDIICNLNSSNIEKDYLGNLFECFLQSSLNGKSVMGEFYTPRHIIRTMLKIANPQTGESVYDPFAGVGGILIEAHKHNQNLILSGGEITTNARLAKMNMILHGGDHSGITQIDSLENPIDGKYDCVITNMPFSQHITLDVSAYYYNGLAKKSGDGVCILHCFKSIKKGGRMALIVPEGVLFKKTLSSLRRFLLENAKLETVISLPQGVFLPYTGVKTSILYFTGCHENTTKEGYIWFYQVENDGYTLNNHRRPIEENDLKYIDYIDFNKKQSLTESLTDDLPKGLMNNLSGFQKIEYETIAQNDYNLIANRYCQSDLNQNLKKKI